MRGKRDVKGSQVGEELPGHDGGMDRGRSMQTDGAAETRRVVDLKPDPIYAIIPRMSAQEHAELMDDIKRDGQLMHVDITADDIVVVGLNRVEALRESGMEQVRVRVVETDDPELYCCTAAAVRRNLTADSVRRWPSSGPSSTSTRGSTNRPLHHMVRRCRTTGPTSTSGPPPVT